MVNPTYSECKALGSELCVAAQVLLPHNGTAVSDDDRSERQLLAGVLQAVYAAADKAAKQKGGVLAQLTDTKAQIVFMQNLTTR